MLSGRQTLSAIEQALADLRREETELAHRIERATRSISSLSEKMSEGFKDLAKFRMETEQADNLGADLEGAARTARQLLERRNADLTRLAEEVRIKESQRAEQMRERDKISAARAAILEKIDALEGALVQALAADEAHKELKAEAEQAARTATAASDKALQAEADREEKGKAYENDPLFMYLWQRGFGTTGYNHSGLVRSLDRWVASLIRFETARPNYAMLTEIPVRLTAHAARYSELANQAADAVAASERQTLARLAGRDLEGEAIELQDALLQLDSRIEADEAELAPLQARLQTFTDGEDEGYQAAAAELAKALQREDLHTLLRKAIDTPSREDDSIVRALQNVEAQIEDLNREIRQDKELQRDISRRRDELTKVSRQFRQNGYDDYGSSFKDDSLTTILLGELVKGAISGADYWTRARKAHVQQNTGSRSSGRSSFGGGFSGQGLGGGSSRGSGGFRTGSSGSVMSQGGGFRTGKTF
ncbi:hypothetical protein [Pannonibacter phragmitetus]|uniref:hypothetical protein n=1 Tax=Pannonibacter phragmitetus TaxID=121719 RepID=UPI003D2F4D2E